MTNKEWLWFKQNDIYRLSNKIPIKVECMSRDVWNRIYKVEMWS